MLDILQKLRFSLIAKVAIFDRATVVTVINRLWAMGAGLITLTLIAKSFAPEIQGYYYTFYSLIALQVFVEMGFNYAIIQLVSHEKANLNWQITGSLIGNSLSQEKIQALLKLVVLWFISGAILLAIILIPGGLMFFIDKYDGNNFYGLIGFPWILLVTCTGMVLLLNAYLAVLEGCGKIEEVAGIRLIQSVATSLGIWGALLCGGGLYAPFIGSVFAIFFGIYFIYLRFRVFIRQYSNFRVSMSSLKWKKEIFPFQWRIGLSWISGYFIFQGLTPIIFMYVGPVAAGQFGMTMQIFGAIGQIAVVWVSTRAPEFGVLIAKGQKQELDKIFFSKLLQSFIVLAVVIFGCTFLYLILNYLNSPYLLRIVSWPLLAIFVLTAFANNAVIAESIYLRAHKEEPFMALSLANGLITLVLAVLLVPIFDSAGAVIAYSVGVIFIGFLGGTYIFFRKRMEWKGLL